MCCFYFCSLIHFFDKNKHLYLPWLVFRDILTGKQRSADVLIRIFEKNQLRPFTTNILTDFALILCIITFWRNVFMKL